MSLTYICQLFGVSRQSYCQSRQRWQGQQQAHTQIVDLVQQQRRLMPRLGTRKVYHLIKADLLRKGIKLGRDGLFSRLRVDGLLIRPSRSYHKTTDSGHWMHKYPNLLKDLVIERPNQV